MSESDTKEKSHPVNHLATHPLTYCCGMTELGNFNYKDGPDHKKMTHFHKMGSGWNPQKNEDANTEEQIRAHIQYVSGGVMCSTGSGQEHVEPILAKIGFKHVYSFKNPGHANTEVKVWCYSKNEMKLAEQ